MFIIPCPKHMEEFEGELRYEAFSVVCENKCIKEMYGELTEINGDKKIFVNKNESLSDEEYKLAVNENGVNIEYGEIVGAYRALTTLKMMLSQCEKGSIGFVKIYDCPSIKNRGYMLDISRGRIPKLSHLKRIIDLLADLKYNQLQLYMDSFVYEYKNFPEYWHDTKPLTKDEIKELDKYCSERFIKFVPNQNSFGHMGAWTKKEELSHLSITGSDGKPSATLNPLKEETLSFIDKIYDGYFDSFSADMVNIGMDEPIELGLNETKEMCDRVGVGKVYTDYLKKVCDLISNKYGKTPMFWDDIVFKHPEQLDFVPKDAILMQWGYETEHHFERNCQSIKDRGLRFYVCPGTSMWQSFVGRTNNVIFNITNSAESASYYGAEGFLLTEWGDCGHPQMASVTYFPIVLGGSVSWNSPDHNSEKAYEKRRELLDLIKAYLDKYIYKTKGDKSLADIVYRMGNYYLYEDCLAFNGTELAIYLCKPELLTEKKRIGISRVLKYMMDIKQELSEITADEDALTEIKFSCDLIIYISKLMCGLHDRLIEEKNDIIRRYKELWLKTSRAIGSEIFIDVLEKAFIEYTK